ncbi:Dabb family protein [Rhodococcus opacus]|uniref:Dabb family protein n=1 Tax=Rhodococcus opacus TaxID=37919 RepID=UPI0009B70FDD
MPKGFQIIRRPNTIRAQCPTRYRPRTRPNNASYALVAHFQDEADFQQYLDHPLHKEPIQSTIVPKCESWLGTQFLTAE